MAGIRAARVGVQTCAGPTQRGMRFWVMFPIALDGTVPAVHMEGWEGIDVPARLAACVEEAIRKVRFPCYLGRALMVKYPMRFD